MGDSERMSQVRVTIVVAEGSLTRKGLLGFVLRGEGYDVVDEAETPADLGRALALHHPDVVVIDDGIGATAVAMTRQMAPAAKIVLVWPEDVVPIGGDTHVPPSAALRELGSAIERLTGVPSATGVRGGGTDAKGSPSIHDVLARERPHHREPVSAISSTKGAAGGTPSPSLERSGGPAVILRAVPGPEITGGGTPLGAADRPVPGGAAPTLLLTVAELAALRAATPPEPVPEPVAAAPLVPVASEVAPVAALEHPEPVAEELAEVQPEPLIEDVPAIDNGASARNRRLGTIALGGAAAAGALVLALALGGSHGPFHDDGRAPSGGPTIGNSPTAPSGPVASPAPVASGRPGAVEGGISPGTGAGSFSPSGNAGDGSPGGGILGTAHVAANGGEATGGTGHGAAPEVAGTLTPDTQPVTTVKQGGQIAAHGTGLLGRTPPHER
jgi:hypothetical protein